MENLDEAPGEGQLCGSYSNWVYRRSWPGVAGRALGFQIIPWTIIVSLRILFPKPPADDR
jgi:hypothetical protein